MPNEPTSGWRVQARLPDGCALVFVLLVLGTVIGWVPGVWVLPGAWAITWVAYAGEYRSPAWTVTAGAWCACALMWYALLLTVLA